VEEEEAEEARRSTLDCALKHKTLFSNLALTFLTSADSKKTIIKKAKRRRPEARKGIRKKG